MRKKQQKLPTPGENIYPYDGLPVIGWVPNGQGLKLATYAWRVKNPKTAVLFIHGVQTHARFEFLRHLQPEEHDLPLPSHRSTGTSDAPVVTPPSSSAYPSRREGLQSRAPGCGRQFMRWCIYEGSWVQQLNEMGCSVYAGDLQSFGLSEGWKGRRCCVERLDHFGSDVICFAGYVASDLAEQAGESEVPPLYLIGISMGGFAVIRSLELMGKTHHWLIQKPGCLAEAKRPRIVGCVALAPMLSVEKASAGALNKAAAKVGGIFSRLTPHFRFIKVLPARFPWIDAQKDEDILVTCPLKLPCRMGVEVLASIPRVHADAKLIPSHLRLLIIHAKQDTIVEPAGSKRFHAESAQHITDRQLHLLEGETGHYLVIEPENTQIISLIKEWISK